MRTPGKVKAMNIARYFSYTQLLESQLERERANHEGEKSEWKADRQQLTDAADRKLSEAQEQYNYEKEEWDYERRHLINVAMLRHGANAPFVSQPTPRNGKQSRTRAVGPWQIAARNALNEQAIEEHKDEVVRAPELPALTDEQKERIRRHAEAKGLIPNNTSEATTSAPATT